MKLHFKTWGKGEPLLVLHGLFGSLDNWHSACLKLAERRQVFALDQRNHGHSPHSPEMNYRLMAEDVLEFVTTHQLPHPNILGHSMGGKTAMQFALLHPERVNKLVVVDIAPRAYPGRHRRILEALLALDLSSLPSRKQAEDTLAAAIPELSLRQFLLKSLARDTRGGFYWRLGLREIDSNYSHLSAAITGTQAFDGPALFLRGETSDYVTDADLSQIKHLFPRASVKVVPKSAHLPHAENLPAFVERVTGFLG